MKILLKSSSVLPGFSPALGFTVFYLSLIVLIPLSAAFIKTTELSWQEFRDVVTAPRVLASYRLSFGASLIGASFNAVFGLIVAWVLVRYEFAGKKIIDALVDLPFALPTAVAGITLSAVYASNGWIGSLLEPYGIKVAYTPLGVVVALTFIGLPFVVRTVQPVLEDLEIEVEDHGRGFEAQAAKQGIGLVAMRERAELLGGVVEFLQPLQSGSGTLVRLRVPREKLDSHAG